MELAITRFWYRRTALAYLAAPIALAAYLLYLLRRAAYRAGLRRVTRLAVPVIIVGNVTAGGTGKTPLVAWLAKALQGAGRTPGIVCRSYRARATGPAAVNPASDPQLQGDEAVLLARRTDSPVWSGPNRVATACALAHAHPEVDVVICDDGLQHYALGRDCEIAVVDGARRFGNGLLLPAGPLREPVARLRCVDAIVWNGEQPPDARSVAVPQFVMRLEGATFYQLVEPARRAGASSFAGRSIAAIAGIGNPQRYFAHLRALGLEFSEHPYPDHHRFQPGDLAALRAEIVLATEKDAIKCAAFADARIWVLPVAATVGEALLGVVVARIGDRPSTRT